MNSKRGFTLIELLVVISVILALAAIAIPNYGRYLNNAYRTNALHNARTCLTGYYASNSEGGSFNPPNGCSISPDGSSCTCTVSGLAGSVTCTVGEGGVVNCE